MRRIGFIGLGTMGKPMAKNLLKAGYEVYVFNRSQGAVQELAAMGAAAPATIGELMEKVECVITILPADAEVKDVYLRSGGLCDHLREGQMAIDMTTCHPQTVIDLADRFAEKKAHLVDAPVSGGKAGAEAGTLSIMVGCHQDIYSQAEPILSAMGKKIFYAGEVGAGKSIKLINQLLASTHMAVLAEAFTLREKVGIAAEIFYQVIKESSGHSRMFDLKMEKFILPRDFSPSFRLALMRKDLSLAVQLSEDVGILPTVARTALQMYDDAVELGFGDLDMSALAKMPLDKD
ncbi:MAG: NAD(P)-dependent oxidoreductase [Limnochordia bacterium]|jgi:2-hydroxymethylglutarate dehydrogenase